MVFFSRKQKTEPPRRRQTEALQDRASERELEERYTFRRNRTLTGSASSHVSTLSESTAQLKSPRVQAHELAKKRRHVGLLLLAVLVCAGILFGLVSQFTAGVIVKMQDDSRRLDASYEELIQSYFAGRPLERLRFMTDEQRLTEYVQTKAPEVEAVKVEGPGGFGVSSFTMMMRRPIAGWSINGSEAYVDASGTAFTRNYYASPAVRVVDNSGIPVQAGQAVASNRFLSFVGRVVGIASVYGYKATEVIIPADTTRQIELKLEGVGYPVKLSIDRGAGVQIEDMTRAIRWLQASNINPAYLDVRVSGRAFYK